MSSSRPDATSCSCEEVSFLHLVPTLLPCVHPSSCHCSICSRSVSFILTSDSEHTSCICSFSGCHLAGVYASRSVFFACGFCFPRWLFRIHQLLQNYWGLLLCRSSSILETGKHNVSDSGSVSISRWGGNTPTLLGSTERDSNISSFQNIVFSSF
jgi:hypothetical protein